MRASDFVRTVMVVLVPVVVCLVWAGLPGPLVKTDDLDMTKPWCLVQTRDGPTPPVRCASPPKAPGGGAAAASTVTPGSPGASGLLGTPVASEPATLGQVRAREVAARLGVTVAGSVVHLASLAAVALAAAVIWTMPWPKAGRLPWRAVALAAAAAAALGGYLAAPFEIRADALRKAMVDDLVGQAVKEGLALPDASTVLRSAMGANLAIGYAACGALLGALVALSVTRKGVATGRFVAERLLGLQVVMVVGALLFTASSYADAQAVGWARGYLDPTAMKPLADALDRLPDLWGVLGSAVLVSSVGAAYWAIRLDDEGGPSGVPVARETAREMSGHPAPSALSPLAFRTADGRDLKVLGWLVNALLALAPACAALKAARIPDLPG